MHEMIINQTRRCSTWFSVALQGTNLEQPLKVTCDAKPRSWNILCWQIWNFSVCNQSYSSLCQSNYRCLPDSARKGRFQTLPVSETPKKTASRKTKGDSGVSFLFPKSKNFPRNHQFTSILCTSQKQPKEQLPSSRQIPELVHVCSAS